MLVNQNVTRRDLLAGSTLLALMGLIGLPPELLAAVPPLDAQGNDPFFGEAFIDKDEWRDKPVRHRFVHGGFAGTDTRFSFYFPPPEAFAGRLIQFLQGGTGGSEYTASSSVKGMGSATDLSFNLGLGAVFMESNQGHFGNDLSGIKGDATILLWRASAQSARQAKKMALEMYGRAVDYAYTYGGSGGGIRSLHCLENTDVYSGGVPFVIPFGMRLQYFSLLANAVRVLGPEALVRVNDAVEVGGSGDPYAGLTPLQEQEVRRLYQSGFPRHMWLNNPVEQVLVWSWMPQFYRRTDPTYFTDFWTKPGYAGHDGTDGVAEDVIDVTTTVERALTAAQMQTYQPPFEVVDERGVGSARMSFGGPNKVVAITTAHKEGTGRMGGAEMTFLSGKAKGRVLYVFGVTGDALAASGLGSEILEGVEPGDRVRINNRDYLAYTLHHRHNVKPGPETRWAFRDGQPIYPQRPMVVPDFAGEYRFTNEKKLIVVQNLQDRGTWPYQAVAYREELRRRKGDAVDEQMMIWFNERAWHGSVGAPAGSVPAGNPPVDVTRLINYSGVVQQALADLIGWVEKGVRPPSGPSNFVLTDDLEIELEPAGAQRGAVQPSVAVTANDAAGRVEVPAGATVAFEANVEVPARAGKLIGAEWDFDGRGLFPLTAQEVDGTTARAILRASHRFEEPGVYYPAVRVWSHRDGDRIDLNRRIPNLGRIRVVVS